MSRRCASSSCRALASAALCCAAALAVASAAAFTYCGVFLERRRSLGAKGCETDSFVEDLTCPITCAVFIDPVSLSNGSTFERSAITEWLRTHNTDPSTNTVLSSKRLTNNIAVKALAQRLTERRARTEQPAGDLLREGFREDEVVAPKALQDGKRAR